jgi:squalene-hopene/tetraprenyl-beta-curcumene cyclase
MDDLPFENRGPVVDTDTEARSSARCNSTSADASAARAALDAGGELLEATSDAIDRTTGWLLAQQHADGYWCGELEGDTILESEYILLLAWLGREGTEIARQAANYLVKKQLPSGGWAMYPGGVPEINGSVKAYFALKLTGHDPRAGYMQRARAVIRDRGGADAVNSFTRFYLALLGQISYRQCPAVPPELVLLPKWWPVHLYRMSAWSRTIVVPLSIMWAFRPSRAIAAERGIRELFVRSPERWGTTRCPGLPDSLASRAWDGFFRGADRMVKLLDRWRVRPLRERGIRAAQKWMIDRFAGSDGLGAIFPPIIWSVVALKCLGYDDHSSEVRYCHRQLEDLVIREADTVRLEPCKSPVWDTSIAMRALEAARSDSARGALLRAADWLLSKEVRHRGDWAQTVAAEPAGWFFEHRNKFYPDTDDTAMVLMALEHQSGRSGAGSTAPAADEPIVLADAATDLANARRRVDLMDRVAAASRRGRAWLIAMQNRDGGWGAFDRDNDAQFLCHVPFADHNAMIDPSTPDLSGRVLEALTRVGPGDEGDLWARAVQRAVDYLRNTQEPDGAWFGRWGVNYIYGTWQVLMGLTMAGVRRDDPAVVRGAKWLLACQQSSGGWGETADSYDDPALRGQGAPTASQTAWAILGLTAAGLAKDPAASRGVDFLVTQQRDDGTWDEPEFTGTGFPRVFYLRYHMYRIYFPLLALANWRDAAAGTESEVRRFLPDRHSEVSDQ